MRNPVNAFCGADIFDGESLLEGKALAVLSDQSIQICDVTELPTDMSIHKLSGGTIFTGFIDLQVNGGGGVMFNDQQSVDTLRKISAAHNSIGTVAFLPTLITDTVERTKAAIDAVDQALKEKVSGIAGIHIEGPHLSVQRKGAHDADLIRPMSQEDLEIYLDAANRLPNVMLTVAPENVSNAQIGILSDAGIIVSLGHSDANYDTCMAAFDAGARCATHLFNAMSPLTSREPGLVGAALAHGGVSAGLIADGIHVHPTVIDLAMRAKSGSDQIFLVTDAMATAGSNIGQFTLNDRVINRNNGQLTLENGTLAGADLEFAQALSVMTQQTETTLCQALKMVTSIPSQLLQEGYDRAFVKQDVTKLHYLDRDLQSVCLLQNA